ncbi:MAG TPA: HlyD family efflux transporter periplasmic adaptor subunit [Opitutus sp.]|nr:HlyD family efflux transporter periplasmic adaptor subunit [Opitutus sp.]
MSSWFCRGVVRAVVIVSLLSLAAGCGRKAVVAKTNAAAAVACLGHLIPGEGVIAVGAPYALGGGPCVLSELRVHRGDRVEAGQVLAVLHTEKAAEADVAAARAEVAVAESALAQVRAGAKPDEIAAERDLVAQREAELANERPAFARAQRLFAEKNIATADLEEAQRRFLMAERALAEAKHREAALAEVRAVDVAHAENQLALARAQLAAAEARLEQTVIRAPCAGVVLDTLLQPGELALATVLSLGTVDAMQVEAYVYDSDIQRVHPGMPATVTSHAFAGELRGTVRDVAPLVLSAPATPESPEAAADRRVVKARITLAPADVKRVAALSDQEVQVVIGR